MVAALQGRAEDRGGAATTISDGKGNLTVVTLLPAKPVIRTVEGGKKQPITQELRKGKYE